MKVYLASSWRNPHQPNIKLALRDAGHMVYDFRHPEPGNDGFHWSDIDPEWKTWSAVTFREALEHPIASSGFALDMTALEESDACVLLMPAGRSASLEAGWAKGAGKPLIIYSPDGIEPELMFKIADYVTDHIAEVVLSLASIEDAITPQTYAYRVDPGFNQMCRICNCTDAHACPEGCHWVESDLCSACAAKAEAQP